MRKTYDQLVLALVVDGECVVRIFDLMFHPVYSPELSSTDSDLWMYGLLGGLCFVPKLQCNTHTYRGNLFQKRYGCNLSLKRRSFISTIYSHYPHCTFSRFKTRHIVYVYSPPPRWILLESPYFPRQQLAMVLRNLSINPSISTYRCGLTKCEMTITQPFTCLILFKYIFLSMQTGLTLSFILSIYILQSSREKLARYYSLPSYKNVTQFSPYQYYEPKSSSCSECAI